MMKDVQDRSADIGSKSIQYHARVRSGHNIVSRGHFVYLGCNAMAVEQAKLHASPSRHRNQDEALTRKSVKSTENTHYPTALASQSRSDTLSGYAMNSPNLQQYYQLGLGPMHTSIFLQLPCT